MHPVFWRVAPLVSLALVTILLPAPARSQSDTLQTLYAFSALDSHGHNLDGAFSRATPALDGQGHLYGTTYEGGSGSATGLGTLFEYDLVTHTFTTLVNFTGPNGAYPYTGVTLDGHGHLYGTTSHGGSNDQGTVFEYDLASGILTTLVTFNGRNGEYPYGVLTLDKQGCLYGTTVQGGSANDGTVFKLHLASHCITTLVSFTGMNGQYPFAGVALDEQGHLYGSTYDGGSGTYGTIFKLNLATHYLTTLVNFNITNGGYPNDVVLDGQGHLYGTTFEGGGNQFNVYYGTVFKVNLATHYLTRLATFYGNGHLNHNNFNNGSYPYGPIMLDGKGHLYGTTYSGGSYDTSNGKGTVFRINLATHAIITIGRLNGSNGAGTYGGVTLDDNGNLYGTAYLGGPNNSGTLFELTPNP